MTLIPDASVDFCFSNAVLEHIPKLDFEKLAIELRRVLKKTGICIYRVDLRDHLGGGLNNLRFSDSMWESTFFKKSGFYTNRIRFSEILNIFNSAGFKCEVTRKLEWPELPCPLFAMDSRFHRYKLDDLRVMGFDMVIKCAD
jgi:SAM-dependent methyltransferase